MTSGLMDGKPVEFVEYLSPGANKDEKQRSDAARAHAAEIGWQKSARAAEIDARRRKCEKADRRSMHKEDPNTGTTYWNETIICSDSQRGADAGTSNRARARVRATQAAAVTAIPRTISPTFGATSFETFHVRNDWMSSQIIILLAHTIWPAAAGVAISKPWFEDFCTSPVLYHAHCMAAASYRDFLANNFLWIDSKVSLMHRTRAISLIREQLAALESMSAQDIEKLIFAMMILSGRELEPRLLVKMDLPFDPHIPTANILRLWGSFEPVVAHQNAAFALIHREGGLHNLRSPGLASMTALTDIFRAGSSPRKPFFPCYWTAHVADVLPENIDEQEFLTSARRPGIGFFKLPGGLPHLAASVLAEVACLDRVMSTFQERPPTGQDLISLLDARCATLHRLFSLPSWDELTRDGRGKSQRAVYEVCRITAVMYCNGVILPIPPHNGWNDRLTAILVGLLSTAKCEAWDVGLPGLHMWALLIGGVAAQGTAQRPFFEDALKRWFAANRQSWSSIVVGLKEFIWSDRACKAAGAALLHRALFGSNVAEPGQGVTITRARPSMDLEALGRAGFIFLA